MKTPTKTSVLGHILCAITLSSASLTIISFFILSASSATATTTSATATVRINSACSLSSNVDTPHTTTLSNGSYSGASGYGQTTFKAFCNDAGGFSIYAIGYTGNEYANTTMHWNKASSSSDNTNAIPTEVYSAGNMSNSSWSMKLASSGGTYAATVVNGTNNEEDFTSWHTIPANYTKVAYRTSGTDTYIDTNSAGSSVTLTYDTYIIATQPAGNYTGQVKFTLVHPNDTVVLPSYQLEPLAASDCPANSICYAPNYSDIIGSMSSLGTIDASDKAGKQTKVNGTSNTDISANTTEIELIAPNYARSGYGFAGWSTSLDATTATNPVIYGPNETIAITAGSLSTNGMILYPVWIASEGDMQNWSGCSELTAATYNSSTGKVSATLDQITALTDTRDGNVYTVAKLADGQCWMVENLRLNNEHTTSAEDIAKAQGYGTYSGTGTNYGNFIGLANSENTNFKRIAPTTTNNATNSLYSSDGSATINIGNDNNPSDRIPRYNNNNTNINFVASHNSIGNYSWQSYGNYYNWPAAIASTINYGLNTDATGTSICPKGWEIPLGGQSVGTLSDGANVASNRVGSFSFLDRIMGGLGSNQTDTIGHEQSIKWRTFPNNFIYSGSIVDSSSGERGSYGYYWSRTNNSDYVSYVAGDLILTNISLYAATGGSYKSYGRTVRCIIAP